MNLYISHRKKQTTSKMQISSSKLYKPTFIVREITISTKDCKLMKSLLKLFNPKAYPTGCRY